jgi:hypothetical protein
LRVTLRHNHPGDLMGFSQRLTAFLAVAALLLTPTAAFAAPKDAVLNKEGYWGIDVDDGACAASMTLQGGSIFLLRALHGQVTFALFARAPLAKGKVVRLETEAYGFDFRAEYADDATSLFHAGGMDARALAALRLARQVRILADGRPVASMTFEGTGFEGALDGVIACSRGEKGWWGPGVGAKPAAQGPAPDKLTPERVFNKEDIWSIAVRSPGVCIAQADGDGDRQLQVLSAAGRLGLAVESADQALPQGRKGHVETDAYAFDFKPSYAGKRFVAMDKPLDSQALFALAHAKKIHISVDGRELLDAYLEGSGFAEALTSVDACSRGEKGWWGEGAPAAR